MKGIIFSAIFFLSALLASAQYGNEWIQYNQFYYKVSVAEDGLYRLTYADLQDAGFPVSIIDPRRLQLYHRSKEQAIHVEGQADAQFNATDFIEFYGKRNDGTQDKHLYSNGDLQPNPYYNLYSDTTAYFLTYNPFPVTGKRIATYFENNVTNIPKEAYHFNEKLLINSQQYSPGRTEDTYLQLSAFDEGEGWTGSQITHGNFIDYTFTEVVGGVPAGGLPQLEVMLVGRGPMSHAVEISAGSGASSLRVLSVENFSGFSKHQVIRSLNWTDIGTDGRVVVRVRTVGVGGSPDRVSACYLKLRYPQTTNAANLPSKVFTLRAEPTAKSYLEINNAPAGTRLYDVTDADDVIRIGTSGTSLLSAVVPSTNVGRTIFLTNRFLTPKIKRINFRQITPSQHNYIIISHPLLMMPAGSHPDAVRAYGGYRASEEGGGYDTLVVDINQLYDQFNYGEPSSLAVRKFMEYMTNYGDPRYLFLIGKGLDVSQPYFRNTDAYALYKNLVPTAGLPGSDIYYTVGLDGTTHEPAVPTGRISAMTATQVVAYLNKVKEMDARPFNELWRKDILHLSGGINPGEPEVFKLFMEGFGTTAKSHYLGGDVKAIAKESNDIELINIAEQVNRGVNLVTFFGHSSPSTIDFDIGFVTDPVLGYNNSGKYPLMIMNGCNAGSVFSYFTVFGEDWVNAADKGAIGFIAHSSYGLVSTLRNYTDLFYKVAYGDSSFFHKGIGDVQKSVVQRYMQTAPASVANLAQVHQMVLLGDPAARVFGAAKPDYEVNDNHIYIESFDDKPVTALSDSFALNIIVRNFGMTRTRLLPVRVTRTFNDNSVMTYDNLFDPVLYQDTLSFIIKKEAASGFGNNGFKVQLDPEGVFEELSESNNSAMLNLFIPLNGTLNLFPQEFSIVHTTSPNLVFQTTDLLSGEREFLLQLDTLNTFDSPYKTEYTVTGKVMVSKLTELLSVDSLTYYWRTKLAQPLSGESEEWVTSSFTFIDNGPEGWAQMHFPQYLKNTMEGLVADPVLRQLKFEEKSTAIEINNFGSAHPNDHTKVSVKINNAQYQLTTQGFTCRNGTINFIAFDKTSTAPYTGIPFVLGNPRSCGRTPQVINSFRPSETDAGGVGDVIQYVNMIPAGDSVVIFSIGDAGYSSWTSNVKIKLGELGISAAQLDALQSGEPVVIFARKGAPAGSAIVHRTSQTPANAQQLLVSGNVTGAYSSGNMKTRLVGPAASWKSLELNYSVTGDDIASVTIVGITIDGDETLLMEDIAVPTNLSSIDASAYPYLRLSYHTSDETDLTAAQLNQWLVLYSPVAEGMLLSKEADPSSVVLWEGEIWQGEYGFVNISDKTFSDSLWVTAEAFNTTTRTSHLQEFKIKAPLPGDTTFFSFVVNTLGKRGPNNINIFVNPRILPEMYYENNVLELHGHLMVQADYFEPVLDVTIDGRKVIDGDFVSPTPVIDIKLWDENKFVFKKDTLGINFFLKYPCIVEGCSFQRISFSDPRVQWQPATAESDFVIQYNPEELFDGVYTLRVEAEDGSGNKAATYEVAFEVKHESGILLLPPYPIPVYDKLTLPLVISGAQVPDAVELHVIDLGGRTVGQIKFTQLIIGTNQLEWNGRDVNDQLLPAGMYIYKLVITKDQQPMSFDVLPGSKYSSQGYGRLLLVR